MAIIKASIYLLTNIEFPNILFTIKIDYEFNKIPTTNGDTSIQMDFSNIPGYNTTENSKLSKRGWLDWFVIKKKKGKKKLVYIKLEIILMHLI